MSKTVILFNVRDENNPHYNGAFRMVIDQPAFDPKDPKHSCSVLEAFGKDATGVARWETCHGRGALPFSERVNNEIVLRLIGAKVTETADGIRHVDIGDIYVPLVQ